MMSKILRILLVGTLCASMLVGCGSTDDKKENNNSGVKPMEKYTLLQSDYIKDAALWQTPSLDANGFRFESHFVPTHNMFVEALMKASVRNYNVGETVSLLPGIQAWEWGYSAGYLRTGKSTGWGVPITKNIFMDSPPTNRLDAVMKLKEFLNTVFKIDSNSTWTSVNGHMPWHHYAGELGADVIGSEIGENIHNYQLQMALNRGAARQYQTPWSVSYSFWMHGVETRYNGEMDNYGHSVSLYERSMVMSYMAGTDIYKPEAGANVHFLTETDSEGFYKLSPHGKVVQNFIKFTKEHNDVGVNYTPIGIVLDRYHGMYYGGNQAKKAFCNFAYNSGDMMSWNLFNTIWPNCWTANETGNETDLMTNKGLGDYFDVLMQNSSDEILNTYPALILSGDISLSAKEKKRYTDYVEQGGILLLNTAYLEQFPSYEKSYAGKNAELKVGKGKVIIYGDDYDIKDAIPYLEEIIKEKVPFNFSAPIQRMVNIKDGSLFVTLINNNGVTKKAKEKTVIDKSKALRVTVEYTGELTPGAEVEDIYNEKTYSLSKNAVTVTVPAGECVILEFTFQE